MKKKFLIIFKKDRSIDVKGDPELDVKFLYVRKGKILTLTGVDQSKRFLFKYGPGSIVNGDIRLAKKPTEMSVEQLRNQLKN